MRRPDHHVVTWENCDIGNGFNQRRGRNEQEKESENSKQFNVGLICLVDVVKCSSDRLFVPYFVFPLKCTYVSPP